MVEHDRPVTHVADRVEAVRDEDDRAALGLERADPVEALALERLVADGEHLVDEKDLRVDVDGHGEREPDVLAGRVELHLGVDLLRDLGEVDDVVEVAVGLRPAEARAATR